MVYKAPKLKLSILDQSPAEDAESSEDALRHTIELAQKAEAWGYRRFWVAEHHGSNRVMGSSPEVMVSHLLAKTERIRVGSGGVMLQHYSPYKVAENFNVLASLAPGRVDLGIGSGPGGLPRSTKALQQEKGPGTVSVPEKLLELKRFLHNQLEEGHPYYGLIASPVAAQPAELYLLGTTPSSAIHAAELGMPYVFALFLNHDESVMRDAVDAYRSRSNHRPDPLVNSPDPLVNSIEGAQPRVMLALPVIVADTDQEAASYASEIIVVRVRLESGRTFTLTSVEGVEEFGRQSQQSFTYVVQESSVVHGSRETVKQKLSDIQRSYQVDEVFVVTAIWDFQKRLHSYELLSDAFALSGAPD
jgi:luciferase family oxidoreductase group 1